MRHSYGKTCKLLKTDDDDSDDDDDDNGDVIMITNPSHYPNVSHKVHSNINLLSIKFPNESLKQLFILKPWPNGLSSSHK